MMAFRSRPGSRLAAALQLAALALLAACARPAPVADWIGNWRVAMQLPGGELPFGLELRAQAGMLSATVVNGPERVPVDEVRLDGDILRLRLSGLETAIEAHRKDGRLEGTVTMVKKKAARQQIPFVAQQGDDYGFVAGDAPSPARLEGRWAVTFTDDDGGESTGVGEFTQQGAQVTGTFLTPTADHRYISGELRGDQALLRSFNGGHAFLYHLQVSGDSLAGDYWSGLASHERIVARRDDSASLGDAEQATKMKPGQERLSFAFLDLDGRRVSIDDARFKGKVVVVTLGGSWCPNCHDEAAFLAPTYRELRAEGLEIVGLMFEQYDSFAEARDAVRRFQQRYAIEYPLLIAGENDRDQAAALLPQLNAVFAYPTTIFIDRAGKVRRIHTGFSGPATGGHYDALKQDYERTVRELLAEKS